VTAPFAATAVGNVQLQLAPPISAATVRDDPDGLVAHLIIAEAVVEIDVVASHDDEGECVPGRARLRLALAPLMS
jgi:hypothetical protein